MATKNERSQRGGQPAIGSSPKLQPSRPPKLPPLTSADTQSTKSKHKQIQPPPKSKPKLGRPRKDPSVPRDKRLVEREQKRAARRSENRKMASSAYREALERDGRKAPIISHRQPGVAGVAPFEPTAEQRAQVQTMAGIGLRLDEIALFLINPATGKPISEGTLREKFARELDVGPISMSANVANSMYRRALSVKDPGAVTAGMFWLKCRRGWKESSVVEVVDKSGVMVALAGMSVEEWIKTQAKQPEHPPE